jgi:hypothetical protein
MSCGVAVKAHKGEPGLWNLQQVDDTNLMREHLWTPLLNLLECKIKCHAPRFARSPPRQFLTCDSSQGEKSTHHASLKSPVRKSVTDWPECWALRTAERPLLWKEILLDGCLQVWHVPKPSLQRPNESAENGPEPLHF